LSPDEGETRSREMVSQSERQRILTPSRVGGKYLPEYLHARIRLDIRETSGVRKRTPWFAGDSVTFFRVPVSPWANAVEWREVESIGVGSDVRFSADERHVDHPLQSAMMEELHDLGKL
jgi:hypothetical protein